jgi:hypothetical protein
LKITFFLSHSFLVWTREKKIFEEFVPKTRLKWILFSKQYFEKNSALYLEKRRRYFFAKLKKTFLYCLFTILVLKDSQHFHHFDLSGCGKQIGM